MSVSKSFIAKNISSRTKLSTAESKLILNSFINQVKSNAISHKVKIPSFGTFFLKDTPERIGRNPKTKQEFIISERSKLKFSASNKLRNLIN